MKKNQKIVWNAPPSDDLFPPPFRWAVSDVVPDPGSLWQAEEDLVIDDLSRPSGAYKRHMYPYVAARRKVLGGSSISFVVPGGGIGVCIGPIYVEEHKRGKVVRVIRHSFLFSSGIFLVADMRDLIPVNLTDAIYNH